MNNSEFLNAINITYDGQNSTLSFIAPNSSVGNNSLTLTYFDSFHQNSTSFVNLFIIVSSFEGPYFSGDPVDKTIYFGQMSFYQLPQILNYNNEQIQLSLVDSASPFPDWISMQNTTILMFPLWKLLSTQTEIDLTINVTLSVLMSNTFNIKVTK